MTRYALVLVNVFNQTKLVCVDAMGEFSARQNALGQQKSNQWQVSTCIELTTSPLQAAKQLAREPIAHVWRA